MLKAFQKSLFQFFTFLPLISIAQSKTNLADGKQLYQKHCVACHQADGGGVPRMSPPLFDTDFTTGEIGRAHV